MDVQKICPRSTSEVKNWEKLDKGYEGTSQTTNGKFQERSYERTVDCKEEPLTSMLFLKGCLGAKSLGFEFGVVVYFVSVCVCICVFLLFIFLFFVFAFFVCICVVFVATAVFELIIR